MIGAPRQRPFAIAKEELLASVLQAASSSLEGLDASEISYASLSEADDDVDPAIIDAIAGNPIPALRPMKKPGGGSLV